MTVLDGIQRSTEFLEKKSVESPRLQAELLLSHLLKLPRMQLYLNFERTLAPAETDAFRELVRRRGAREPLQYIVGTTSFCGLEIAVNSHVLIPRPETEQLAEKGWAFLSERAQTGISENGDLSELRALDFGTGSGCLAIALAANCQHVKVGAVDVSADALSVARHNVEKHCLSHRISLEHADSLKLLKNSTFDLIIGNPPYIPTSDIESLEPEVRDFEPRGALDGGADGFDFFHRLAHEAKTLLKPEGRMMLEFGDGQAEAIGKIFETEKWIVEGVQSDYSGRARIITVGRT